jgi:hypothetical protein
MAQMLNAIQGTINAVNGTVGPVGMLNANATMLVTGTWVGSVALQARVRGDPNNAWALIATARSTNGISNVPGIAGDMEFRAVCTAYTSGTIICYVAASPSS